MVILEKYKGNNKIIGNLGEEITVQYLIKNNYLILERNFRCYYGEIDIIALKEKQCIFFEVKTRRSNNFGNPSEAVDYYKKKHIWNCARYFLYKTRRLNISVRFDVIEIYIYKKKISLNHIKNVDIF